MAFNKREKMIGAIFIAVAALWLLTLRSGPGPAVSRAKQPAPANPAVSAKPDAEVISTDALRVLDKISLQTEGRQPAGEIGDPFRKFEAKDLMDRKILELAELKLKGIIVENGAYVALINDQILRRGDTVSGFRVAEIRSNEVVLVKGMEKHTLRLFEDQ